MIFQENSFSKKNNSFSRFLYFLDPKILAKIIWQKLKIFFQNSAKNDDFSNFNQNVKNLILRIPHLTQPNLTTSRIYALPPLPARSH